VLDLTNDGEPDLVVSTFDGRLVAVDGATGKPLWERADPREETYHQPAVVRLPGGKLGLFVSRGVGVFPKYVASVHRLHDAADGHVLWEYHDANYPAGAPLAVDLTGDGVDEPVFFSVRFPSGQGSRVYVLHVPTRRLVAHDLALNLWSTPLVAAVRGKGALELAGPAWQVLEGPGSDTLPAWRNLRWELLRLDLSAKAPAAITWGAYMGTSSDGQYRPANGGTP
jgi:outer membrane protein assembly factor BamB